MNRIPLKTYLKLCTEFYDLENHVHDAQAVAFYTELALRIGGPILEPMCGSGRFLIPILQLGLDAEGFDASPHMLEAFKQKYALVSDQSAPVWQQFVQDFVGTKNYRLIFIPYGSLGLITDLADAKKGLAALYRHLESGGTLVLEIETVASVPELCGVWRRGVHTRADCSKLVLNFLASYEPAAQIFRSQSRYESLVNGVVQETEEELFEQYLYRFDELDVMLRDVGFSMIKKYPAFDPTKSVDQTTPIIIYECVK